MAAWSHRPWYKVSTPEQKRALEAENWRRQVTAQLFRAAHTQGEEDASEIIRRTGKEWGRNPLGPKDDGDILDPLAPPEVQMAADREQAVTRGLQPAPVKQPGVPRGVAEAFPEEAVGRKVYDSSTSGAGDIARGVGGLAAGLNEPLASPKGLPGPARMLVEELTRPTNALLALRGPATAARGIPVVGKVAGALLEPGTGGFARRLITSAGANAGARIASEETAQRLPEDTNPAVGFAAQLVAGLAGGVAGGAAGGALAARAPEAAVRYKNVTQNIPVGASVKDVSGGLPDDAPLSLDDARGLLRKTWEDAQARRASGETDEAIRAGRAQQFANVREATDEAARRGLTGTERTRFIRNAARGPIRPGGPVPIPESAVNAFMDEITTNLADPSKSADQYLRMTGALNELVTRGDAQPAQLDVLRPLLGDDLVSMIKKDLPKVAPSGQRGSLPATGARGGGPRLGGKSGLPATGPEVPRAGRGKQAEPMRMGDYTKQRIAQEEAEKAYWLSQIGKSAPKFEERATGAGPRLGPELSIPTAGRGRKADDLLRDPRAAEKYAREQRSIPKTAEAARLKELGPNEDELLTKARDLLSTEERISPLPGAKPIKSMKPQVEAALEYWLDGNRDILDNMGPEMNQLTAAITGNVADSHLAALYSRRNTLATQLRSVWGDVADNEAALGRDAIISKVSDALLQRELKLRYGDKIPDRITELMKTTAPLPYEESLGGLQTAVQRAKNSMFGVTDVSAFGIQGLSAINRGGVPMLAGLINKMLATLHMPNVATMYSESALPKQIQYGLDGVSQGATSSPLAKKKGQKEIGSMLSYLGPPGRFLDKGYMAAADKLSDFQFGTIVGTLRNLAYEGDLVLAHIAGQDITNGAVRRQAAANANMIGSWAESAVRKSRAQGESVIFTSAPMTRARFNHVTQMAKLITPKASPTERILAASTIASTVGFTLLMGKLVNDRIGVGEFEFDPSKPSFGQIVLKNGTVIDVVPQDAVTRAYAKSVRAIMEADPEMLTKAWTNVFIGSGSPVTRFGMQAAGVGYEPGRGYRYGDVARKGPLNVLNLAPIPPGALSLIHQGFEPFNAALDTVGITNFQESALSEAGRLYKDQYGGEFSDATSAQKKEFYGANPKVAERLDAETLKQAQNGDRQAQARAVGIETRKLLSDLAGSTTSLADYREKRRDIMLKQQGKLAAYQDVIDDWKGSRNEIEQLTAGYFDLFDQAKGPGGLLDPEKFDRLEAAYIAQLGDKWSAVQANMGALDPRDNPMEQRLDRTRTALDQTGFFDIKDSTWAEMQGRMRGKVKAEAAQFDDFYSYRDELAAQLVERLVQRGLSPEIAQRRAEIMVNSHVAVNAYEKMVQRKRAEWAKANPELARDAIAAGYLSASKLNIGASGAITRR